MPLLEMLSLSVNKIGSLRHFARCVNLVELHLRKNEVADLTEVRHLVGLRNLRVLWLCDNPCADAPDYRARVISMLPGLAKLDNEEISDDERRAATAGGAASSRANGSFSAGGGAGIPRGESWTLSSPSGGGGDGRSGLALPRAPSRSPGGSSPTTPSAPAPAAASAPSCSSSNVLYAVMALLAELDDESLHIVHREVEQRLGVGVDA